MSYKLISVQTKGEIAVQEFIADALECAGCQVQRHDYTPADVPMIGEFVVNSAPVSDIDKWQYPPFEGKASNGRIYGWGIADDLAGCAAAICVVRELAKIDQPLGDLNFASTPAKNHARGVAA